MRGNAESSFLRRRIHVWIAVAFALWWAVMAIKPASRADWLLENLLVFFGVPLFLWLERRVRFSTLAWLAVALFLAVHVYGSHYTYSDAPLGYWLREAWGTVRNPYDRMVHFLFGSLLVLPMREVLNARTVSGPMARSLLAIACIVALSTVYELLEWIAMLVVAPDLGIAFMGTQGDVFDAHKDSGLALFGAITGIGLSTVIGWTQSTARRNRKPMN